MYSCLWLLRRYKAVSTAKPNTLAPGHLSLPTSALNDVYLILTSLFTLPHWLCSSHNSFLAVPRYPRQAPTSRSLPMLRQAPTSRSLHCPCYFLFWAKTSTHTHTLSTARLACATTESLYLAVTSGRPSPTILQLKLRPQHTENPLIHTFPLLSLSFSLALTVKYDT